MFTSRIKSTILKQKRIFTVSKFCLVNSAFEKSVRFSFSDIKWVYFATTEIKKIENTLKLLFQRKKKTEILLIKNPAVLRIPSNCNFLIFQTQ